MAVRWPFVSAIAAPTVGEVSVLLELRQYLLHPGQRETLIEVFDREFVESQEAQGLEIVGQFRDPDRPDHFVWIRGYADPTPNARAEALAAFYGGPVWAAHRDVANATMIEFHDVHVLRAITAHDALPVHQPSRREDPVGDGHVVLVIEALDPVDPHHAVSLDDSTDDSTRAPVPAPIGIETIASFVSITMPELAAAGCRTLGVYATEPAANPFPVLPVRTDRVVVWIGATDRSDHGALRADLGPSTPDRQVLILAPTDRSVLRGSTLR
jgi:hypothetical protein